MFLKLFINHRPVYGITKNNITNALSILGTGTDSQGNPTISRDDLIKILASEG
jgi:hypothetical protein